MRNIYAFPDYGDAIVQAEAHSVAAKNVSVLLAEQRRKGEHNPYEAMLRNWIEHAE